LENPTCEQRASDIGRAGFEPATPGLKIQIAYSG